APADAKNTKNPEKGTDLGKKSVETNCVPCHGPSGKGDGPAAAALTPKPANWTSDKVKKEADGELFWKISNGRGPMPPWKHLPEKERWQIVNYIRTLQK
ncbi:MAG: cytochrome c class I, partial [Candidatus Rokuibacteriota bacterium]